MQHFLYIKYFNCPTLHKCGKQHTDKGNENTCNILNNIRARYADHNKQCIPHTGLFCVAVFYLYDTFPLGKKIPRKCFATPSKGKYIPRKSFAIPSEGKNIPAKCFATSSQGKNAPAKILLPLPRAKLSQQNVLLPLPRAKMLQQNFCCFIRGQPCRGHTIRLLPAMAKRQ